MNRIIQIPIQVIEPLPLEDRMIASYRARDRDNISADRLLQEVAKDCGCSVYEVYKTLFERKE